MEFLTDRPNELEFDVIVAGSGGPGLTAALAAATRGKQVIVLERSALIGGTTAVSGGQLWVPGNRYASEAGHSDSLDDAARYLEGVFRGRGRAQLAATVLAKGDELLEFLQREAELRFAVLERSPDYRQDLDGAREGGRSIEPTLTNARDLLGDFVARLRTDGRLPMTVDEAQSWGAPTRWPMPMLESRQDAGVVAKGPALVASLFAACLRAGVSFAVEARAVELIDRAGGAGGVRLESGEAVLARDGVVLATGGFEWDSELTDGFLQSRVYGTCTPPNNDGDGYRMTQQWGARMGSLREAWWIPVAHAGDRRDGTPVATLLRFERQGPGSIMVNRHGKRFANESQNYNSLARSFHSWDSANNQTLNTPVHLIVDHRYVRDYGLFEFREGEHLPPYITRADDLPSLAAALALPLEALSETLTRFNEFARAGDDQDFGRGRDAYDRYWGDAANAWPNPALAPLEEPPFYAVEVVNGVAGTCGGPSTTDAGQVIDVRGEPIPRLYAVGNVAESPYAAGYPGAGTTLGAGMTMGYLAGLAV